MAGDLARLLAPRHIALYGGAAAAEAVRQCRAVGYEGQLWPVNPKRNTLEGLPCYPGTSALPEAPDAAFVAVPADATVDVVAQLSARGAGGAVCHASGFAEDGPDGARRERHLRDAAGGMPVIGPNCIGVLNYLDGAALWADQHGGSRTDTGVAVVTQSGNIGQNITMQRRALPLACMVTAGNSAVTRVPQLIDALLEDPRITAIGLHLEGITDAAAFSAAALRALRRGVPVVALKTGSSDLGARANLSHTSSLAGSDVLCDALFRRAGVARVHDVGTFVETLKLLHVHGALGSPAPAALPGPAAAATPGAAATPAATAGAAGTAADPGAAAEPGATAAPEGLRDRARIASASCSGGEAALVADTAERYGVGLPGLPDDTVRQLQDVLGDSVHIRNPLDYHTYIWGDFAAQRACFGALLSAGHDMNLLLLDLPRTDRCDSGPWTTTLEAFAAARRDTDAPACVVGSLPEGLPEDTAQRLLRAGVAPMQGLADCLRAVAAAHRIGIAQRTADAVPPLPPPARPPDHGSSGSSGSSGSGSGRGVLLDEDAGKRELASYGTPVPYGAVATAGDAAQVARNMGFPAVAKALSPDLAHKSEAGGVHLGLTDEHEVHDAVAAMSGLTDRFLVERMVPGAVAELLVGVHRDPVFGPALTLGAGGVLVELLRDTATLLLPAAPAQIEDALRSLRVWPVLRGFRGRAPGDVAAVVDAVHTVAAYVQDHADVTELDVNPLLVLPEGRGVVAADVLVRRTPHHHPH